MLFLTLAGHIQSVQVFLTNMYINSYVADLKYS
jgi:hypothetical protein